MSEGRGSGLAREEARGDARCKQALRRHLVLVQHREHHFDHVVWVGSAAGRHAARARHGARGAHHAARRAHHAAAHASRAHHLRHPTRVHAGRSDLRAFGLDLLRLLPSSLGGLQVVQLRGGAAEQQRDQREAHLGREGQSRRARRLDAYGKACIRA